MKVGINNVRIGISIGNFFGKSFNKSERAPGPIFEFQPPQTIILNFLFDILASFIFISLFEIYKKIT